MHDYFLTRVSLYGQLNQTKVLPITKHITCRYEPGHTSSNVKLVESEYEIGEEFLLSVTVVKIVKLAQTDT